MYLSELSQPRRLHLPCRWVTTRLQLLIMSSQIVVGICGRKSQLPASLEENTSPLCLLVRVWFVVYGFIDFKHQKNIYEIGMSIGNYCGLMWHSLHDVFFLSFLSAVYCLSLPGTIHAIFEKSNNHYTWKKVTTTVHNIIVGKLWIDQVSVSLQESVWSGEWGSTLQQTILPGWKCLHSHFSSVSRQSGEIDVVNHTTGDRCHLKFAPYSYFSRDVARKVRNLLFQFQHLSGNIFSFI